MSNLYWYVEYGKVAAAYAVLLYVWPSVMFRGFLRGKGLTFRFLFCATVPLVLYNGVVLGLGLLHILKPWLVRALFYGALLVSVGLPLLRRELEMSAQGKPRRRLPPWRQGWKMYLARLGDRARRRWDLFWRDYRGRRVEYGILTVLLFFGVLFFSWPALRNPAYGCYDAYTHTQWLFQMRWEGGIFYNGVYPYGLHCFIYGLNVLFGVKMYSCVLYLGGIHTVAFLLALYCLLKELFLCRYTPLFVLTLFLTFNGCIVGKAHEMALASMTRLAWTLPQEFGLHLAFLCPLVLIRFFREKRYDGDAKHWFRDENLLLLSMGVGGSLATHFYITVLAFLPCLLVSLLHFKKFVSARRFPSLFCSIWDGAVAGTLPMLTAYALGRRLEGSLGWGMRTYAGTGGGAAEIIAKQAAVASPGKTALPGGFYAMGYGAIFGGIGALVLALTLLIPVCLGIVWIYGNSARKGKRSFPELSWDQSAGYLLIAAASVLMVFLYASRFMGLPEFISVDRIFAILRAWVYAVPWVFVDIPLSLAASGRHERAARRAAVLICAGIYCFSYLVDFHEYVFWMPKRHESVVRVTAEITRQFEPGSYAVISMGDEWPQVEDSGSCVQLLDFVDAVEGSRPYSISEEYLFLYVEKQPIMPRMAWYFTGPAWLGRKSTECRDVSKDRYYPDVIKGRISKNAAEQTVDFDELKRDYYGSYFQLPTREMLCSKAWYWYQEFMRVYPTDSNVYYEDEDFICYVIHQNPEAPLDLAIMRG